MRDYAVLLRDRHPDRAPDIALVPYGFSWGAFLFQALWALYRGVWFTAIVLLVAAMAISLLADLSGLDPLGTATVEIAGSLILAFAAQDLRRFELIRRGFALAGFVRADSLAQAEARAIAGLVDQAVEQPVEHSGGATELSHSQGLQPLANRSM